jgi:hypothetical protein
VSGFDSGGPPSLRLVGAWDDEAVRAAVRSTLGTAPLHVVRVTPKRIECALHCAGPDPHIGEYRAQDVNPNR